MARERLIKKPEKTLSLHIRLILSIEIAYNKSKN